MEFTKDYSNLSTNVELIKNILISSTPQNDDEMQTLILRTYKALSSKDVFETFKDHYEFRKVVSHKIMEISMIFPVFFMLHLTLFNKVLGMYMPLE